MPIMCLLQSQNISNCDLSLNSDNSHSFWHKVMVLLCFQARVHLLTITIDLVISNNRHPDFGLSMSVKSHCFFKSQSSHPDVF